MSIIAMHSGLLAASLLLGNSGQDYWVPRFWPDDARVAPQEYYNERCLEMYGAVNSLAWSRHDTHQGYIAAHLDAKAPMAVVLHIDETAREYAEGLPPPRQNERSASAPSARIAAQCRKRADSAAVREFIRQADDIPDTIEEAHRQMARDLGHAYIDEILAYPSEKHILQTDIGLWDLLMESWGFYGPSPLRSYFESLGYRDPGDMAEAVIESFWLSRHHRPLRMRERAEEKEREYQESQRRWAEAEQQRKQKAAGQPAAQSSAVDPR